jgi:hypothetical protein
MRFPGQGEYSDDGRAHHPPFRKGWKDRHGRGFPLTHVAEQVVIVVDDDAGVREALRALIKLAQLNVAVFAVRRGCFASGLLASASCLISDVLYAGDAGSGTRRDILRASSGSRMTSSKENIV